VLITLLMGCSQSTEKKVLKVLVSADFPPYESIDTDGSFIGFDIDFGNALAKKMGVEIQWVDTSFSGIIAALQANSGDMAISGMSITPEREEAVDFSSVYKEEGETFTVLALASKGYSSATDLNGLIGSAQIGTVQEQALNLLKNDLALTVDIRDKYDVIVQEIIIGRIDFLLVDAAVANEFVAAYPELATFTLQHASLATINGIGVAMPQGSPLKDDVNAAIAEMKADGSLQALIDQWFNN
jgi:ABC-type amino acid transport substrate-binding protein